MMWRLLLAVSFCMWQELDAVDEQVSVHPLESKLGRAARPCSICSWLSSPHSKKAADSQPTQIFVGPQHTHRHFGVGG